MPEHDAAVCNTSIAAGKLGVTTPRDTNKTRSMGVETRTRCDPSATSIRRRGLRTSPAASGVTLPNNSRPTHFARRSSPIPRSIPHADLGAGRGGLDRSSRPP